MTNWKNKTIYIIFMPGYNPVHSFYHLEPDQPKDICHFLREEIEKRGFNLRFTIDAKELTDVAAIISWNLNQTIVDNIIQYPTHKCFLLIFEPPLIAPYFFHPSLKYYFGNIFTSIDEQVDNKNYFKIQTQARRLIPLENIPDFSQKKFCTIINCNKNYLGEGELYTERQRAVSFFSETDDFDLYGHGWNGYSRWKGLIGNNGKYNVLKNYKFTVCFENSAPNGYITERLVDAFVSGCVPVYLGPLNISNYIPKECFINFRDFSSYPDLYDYMNSMDLAVYENFRNAAIKYLNSPQVKHFSSEHAAQMIMDQVVNAQFI
jgi:alpha(1,3/1,4) fucosyltransferase